MTFRIQGATSGYVEVDCQPTGGNNTVLLPSSNGSANQFLKNGSTAGTLGWSSMIEDVSGNVGIGTTTIQYATANRTAITLNGTNSCLFGFAASNSAVGYLSGFSSGIEMAAEGSRILTFLTNGSERMRISSSGDFIKKPGSAARPTPTAGDSGFYSDGGFGDGISLGNTYGGGKAYINLFYNTTIIGNVTANGTTGVSYNTSSDYRLKENVVPLTGAIDRVNQLQVRRFNFITDPGRTVDGFIAHEAQAVVPECVTGEKDAIDEDGNPIYQGIDQSKLVPLLTAALQEAIAKIETLEASNADLAARLAALEAQS